MSGSLPWPPSLTAPLVRSIAAYGLGGSNVTVQQCFPLVEGPLNQSDWKSLVSVAERERILGLVANAVADRVLSIDDEQALELHDLQVNQLSQDLILERRLIDVVRLLTKSGLDHRVLKGTAIAHLDYPDPALRSFADVDLLVRADEWDDAITVLGKAGWQRHFSEPRPGFDRRFIKGVVLTHRGDDTGPELDLHRTLALGPFGLTVRLADLWNSHENFSIGGQQLRALPAEERFLHACLHSMLGDFPARLVPIRDVAQIGLSGKLDRERVMDLARAWRMEVVLLQATQLAWDALTLDGSSEPLIPTGWLNPTRRQIKALDAYLSPARSYVGLCIAAARVIPRPSDKARYLTALAFPSREFLTPRYGSRLDRWRSAGRAVLAGRGQTAAITRRGSR